MNPPVSVKGIVTVDGRVVLLRNDRDEWELPGGRIDPGEDEVAALGREIREELGIEAVVVPEPLDRYDFAPIPGTLVTIVTYACEPLVGDTALVLSDEHVDVGTFSVDDAPALPDLPPGYRASIAGHLMA